MSLRFVECLFAASIAAAPVLALAAQDPKAEPSTQTTKESQHEELLRLARQIAELRASSAPAPRIQELSERYVAISRSLGGDDPGSLLQTGPALAPAAGSGSAPHALVVPPACGGAAVTTINVPGVGGPITPPQPFQGVTFTTVVSGAGTYLWDVNLNTMITHTSAADLDITLESPAGTIVKITTDNGGANDDVFNGTLWDDSVNLPATDFIYTNMVPAAQLSPEGRLSAFRGEDPNGTWSLKILDDAAANTGNLASWSLDLDTLAAPPAESTTTTSNTPNMAILDSATVFDTMSIGGLPNYLDKVVLYVEVTHTYAADLDITLTSPAGTIVTVTTDNGGANDDVFNGTSFDPDSLDTVTDHTYLNLTVAPLLSPEGAFDNFLGQDPNGNWTLTITDDAGADVGTLVRWDLSITTTTSPALLGVVNYAGPAGAIPDFQGATAQATVYTTTVSGAGASLWDVDLSTFITHTAAADLDITLSSPAGTIVTVTTDNGAALDDVFNGTLWDDNVNAPATDYAYVNLTLASPLSPEGRFANFRGENPNGIWTLTITDDALADNGTLTSWSLDVSTVTAAPATVSSTSSRTPNLTILTTGPNSVSDVMPISGLGTSITEVEVYLEITHTYAADLDLTLTSPGGSVVALSTDNGGTFDNVFNGTLFDGDVSDTATDHVYANLVVVPLLSPEGSFDNFAGQDPNGNWTLTVADDLTADGGVFVRWDLTIRTCTSGPGTTYCDPGSGGVIACPCGNSPPGSGQGCANSLGSGASIAGAGSASLSADTLVISASSIQSAGVSCQGNSPSLTSILLQGTATNPGGIGFNDGVRCFAGSLKRLQTASSVGGVFTSTVSISATSAGLGDPIVAGTSRYYGVWYRDACASWGCAAPLNSNVSNSYAVLWNP